MATKNTQQRNIQALIFIFCLDTMEIRTSGGSTVLATFTGVAWDIPATGAVSLSSTIEDTSADATGTAAEARLYHTNGGGSGYLVNTGSAAVGDVEIAVDTGSGTLNKGDIVRFAGSNQDYVLTEALTGAGTMKFFPPLVAAPADNAAITQQTAPEISGLTVGTSGSDVNLDSTSITSGQSVSITSGTLTVPAATA